MSYTELTSAYIRANYRFGFLKNDPWKLPPLIYIRGDVKEIKASYGIGPANDKRERRWLAACIILGQPFA